MNIKDIAPYATAYDKYCYLWPPRPENMIPADSLPTFDNEEYVGQPKLNGANVLLFMNDAAEVHAMNRHNQTKQGVKLDYNNLYRGSGWLVLNGEWMEKSCNNEDGSNFNGNFIIFDILVYNGHILTGSTVKSRVHLLSDLYNTEASTASQFLYTTSTPNVYRVKSYASEFRTLYNLMTPIDMFEGLVLKRKSGVLKYPSTKTANSKWQFKARKQTKNYKF